MLDNTYVLVYNLPYIRGCIALTNKDLSDMVNQIIKDHGISKTFIASKMGISRQQLDNILKKKHFSINDANSILNIIGYCIDKIEIKKL